MQQPFGVKALAHASRRVVQKARVQELNDATDAAGLPPEAAAMDLFDTVPTTLNGIIDALFYMRIQHRNNGEHMIEGGSRTRMASATSTGAMYGLRLSSRPSCSWSTRRGRLHYWPRPDEAKAPRS
jgi:hypothetical protein